MTIGKKNNSCKSDTRKYIYLHVRLWNSVYIQCTSCGKKIPETKRT